MSRTVWPEREPGVFRRGHAPAHCRGVFGHGLLKRIPARNHLLIGQTQIPAAVFGGGDRRRLGRAIGDDHDDLARRPHLIESLGRRIDRRLADIEHAETIEYEGIEVLEQLEQRGLMFAGRSTGQRRHDGKPGPDLFVAAERPGGIRARGRDGNVGRIDGVVGMLGHEP